MQKLAIKPQSVQETMLIPLWGKSKYSQLYPELLNDLQSCEIIKKVDYDFSKIERGLGEYGGICYLVRANSFDNAIKKYIAKYPEATIINLGAGLDTTFLRIDNGKIMWYDLDLLDSITFRKKVIQDTSRSKCIAKSVFNTSWFNDIEYQNEKGIYFIAGGLFHYFKENEISNLISDMANKFTNGEMIFDASSKIGIKCSNRMVKKTGNKGAEMYFGLDNPVKQISKWSDKIEITNWYSYFQNIKRDPKWNWKTVFQMNICDLFKMVKFVELKFIE